MLNNLKAIYLRQEDFPKALATAERLLIIDPTSPQEIRDRGLLYLKLDHFSQAIDDLETYLRLAPDAADILHQLDTLKKSAARLH